ncbi:TAXI family TRAP transporter solute-binding subunit [Iningainema tapete]|uniref:TAXI family TRAP transporter solute-binding subunit n=1 Tax=Iningainema tapete BLCC-T55 TaxID=2748662 RepID=A0A8J6XMX4_9CYAN|nr:TAXI family TRAP transporter solute-binding subunit [Iningainema tapete]MBD2775916.1 TAXI family TRAP transporter solute-binding subunit [Iningainema tapete BLCC-T55]
MAALKISTTKFLAFFRTLDPLSKFIFISLGFTSISLALLIISNIVIRVTGPELILAAGDKEGESYIISEAIKKVVEQKSNIKIKVEPTGGTAENIQKLEQGEVALATAQADVLAEEMDVISPRKYNSQQPIKAAPQTVAVLYKDLFQLVVRDANIKQFVQLKGKNIALPTQGGQYKSFQKVAEHYGLVREDKKTLDLTVTGANNGSYNDSQAEQDFQLGIADALFRVRALGNRGISTLVQEKDGRLVAIAQAEAMKVKHPAFERAIIPEGTYRGAQPVPERDLSTVAVSRLLVASDKVDKGVIQEITSIIFENRQEIAKAISNQHPEVKPLVASISQPSSNTSASGIPPIHPGAIAYYDQDKPSFIQQNADFLALILTVILLIVSWIRQFRLWVANSRKENADTYINAAINLMTGQRQNLDSRQLALDIVFTDAASALVKERISQESFRTFNEAYKTTREAIERERQLEQQKIEQEQKVLSADYINEVVTLLQTSKHNKDLLLQQLDRVLQKVAKDLIDKKISQESFRTFIEAYKTTRDAIERN